MLVSQTNWAAVAPNIPAKANRGPTQQVQASSAVATAPMDDNKDFIDD